MPLNGDSLVFIAATDHTSPHILQSAHSRGDGEGRAHPTLGLWLSKC